MKSKLTILAILSVVFLFGTRAFSGTSKISPESVTFPVKISKDKRYFTGSTTGICSVIMAAGIPEVI